MRRENSTDSDADSADFEEQEMDFSMRILLKLRNHLKEGKDPNELEEFALHIFGGSGQRYTKEYVSLFREIQSLGGTIHNCVWSVNKYGDTALILGAIHRDYELVEFLMENGADPAHKRHNGYTVYDYADSETKRLIARGLELRDRKNKIAL